MSGIVGIIHLDGASIEAKLLQNLTNLMSDRGIDAQTIWYSGAVGLGNALLRTTRESEKENQPFTLDGETWITADARLDARGELCHKLAIDEKLALPDGELILHAYHSWGEDCVENLRGDFAFAIWDGKRQRLFCARDQLGVKLFYYARVGNCFLFSNTLKCLRCHPLVSSRLNESALGDFLLFELNYQPDTTTFEDIKRLPPAHTLKLSQGKIATRRYWNLPVPEIIRYSNPQDYVEHFRTVMELAVADRLRTSQAAMLFSGGLDSTTIAATAISSGKKSTQPCHLRGFTTIYEHVIPDQEKYYAKIAGEALGISVNYLVADDYQLYQGWQDFQTPEPYHEPLAIIDRDQLQLISKHTRVALNGQGGDEVLFPPTVVEMFKAMAMQDVVMGIFGCLRYQLRPSLGLGIVAKWRRLRRGETPDYYPKWLNPDFARRLQLQERWQEINYTKPETIHPFRNQAYQDLLSPLWQPFFEGYDPGFFGIPVEVRLPFLDIRLINYLLAIPPLPWCVGKQLMRLAMEGILPEEVRLRRKTPVQGDPIGQRLARNEFPWQQLETVPEINHYVNKSLIQDTVTSSNLDSWTAWEMLRSVSLRYWLQHLLSV